MLESSYRPAIHSEMTAEDQSWYVSFRTLSGHHEHHVHGGIEILYIYEGKRTLFVENRTLDLIPGQLLIINTHVMHRAVNPSKRRCEGALIYIHDMPSRRPGATEMSTTSASRGSGRSRAMLEHSEPPFFREILPAFPELFSFPFMVISLEAQDRDTVESILWEIRKNLETESIGRDYAVKAAVSYLLVKARRSLRGTGEKPASAPLGESRIKEAIAYLSANYMENLNLERVASHFHMTPTSFSRFFRQRSGFSYVEFLNTVRIRESIRLIRNGNRTMVEIAEMVGFGSPSHFGRVFRQVTGRRPSSYRRIKSLESPRPIERNNTNHGRIESR